MPFSRASISSIFAQVAAISCRQAGVSIVSVATGTTPTSKTADTSAARESIATPGYDWAIAADRDRLVSAAVASCAWVPHAPRETAADEEPSGVVSVMRG